MAIFEPLTTSRRYDRASSLISCKINSEIQSVMALMRQNSNWGMVPRFLDEQEQDDPLMEDFRELRRMLFSNPTVVASSPNFFLDPFLAVIRSERTNTPITGAALTAVHKFLALELFDSSSEGAAIAMRSIIDSVIQCRFEVTDQASEEIVLAKILQILLASLKCSAGSLLSDKDVCNIVNTCFRIVHQSGTKGDLLQRLACSTMQDLVRTIFSNLQNIPELEKGAQEEGNDAEGAMVISEDTKEKVVVGSTSLEKENEPTNAYEGDEENLLPTFPTFSHDLQGSGRYGNNQLVSESIPGPLIKSWKPHGIACMIEIFHFLCSLLTLEPSAITGSVFGAGDDEMPLFALGLIHSALELSGDSILKHPRYLSLVQDELFRNLLHIGLSPQVLPLSLSCSVTVTLHSFLRARLKRQLEAFLLVVIARPLSGGKATSPYATPFLHQQQEVVLETLLDLTRQPNFALEMYCNYDCDLDCTDLLREITAMVSRAAFPVNTPLTVVNALALRVLLAILDSLDGRLVDSPAGEPSPPGRATREELETFWDWSMVLTGRKSEESNGELAWNEGRERLEKGGGFCDFFRKRRSIKRKLQLAIDHFNRDPKKGVQFLQGAGFLNPTEGNAPDPKSVARFLRHAPPGISKSVLGEYLGDHREPNVSVLSEFAVLFDFSGMRLDVALRAFLEHFRLPGEAQKIERVLDVFAKRYYEQSQGVLANQDAAHILSYSVILLNTDLHNPQVKKKMTEDGFIRNNRGINDNKDLPKSMLQEIYRSISRDEIRISGDSVDGTGADMTFGRWIDLVRRSPHGVPFLEASPSPPLDYDVFRVIGGSTLAALSVIFDHAEDEKLLEECRNGFLSISRVSSHYSLEETLDDVVKDLCRKSTLLNPDFGGFGAFSESTNQEDTSVSFWEGLKARLATEAAFQVAKSHGDQIRASWRNLLDCVVRLHKLNLLPARVLSGEPSLGSDPFQAPVPDLNPYPTTLSLLTQNPEPMKKKSSSGLISRVSQLLLLEESAADSAAFEPLTNTSDVIAFVASLELDAIFSDSCFLQPDSLIQLTRALTNSFLPPVRAAPAPSPSQRPPPPPPQDPDTAVFCLELLLKTVLANRDRLGLVWPILCDHLSNILSSSPPPSPALAERAVLGLLRLLRRLLPYKEPSIGDDLLKSLALVQRLDISLADQMCGKIATELLGLVQACAPHVSAPASWRSLFDLLRITAGHPDGTSAGFQAIRFLAEGVPVTESAEQGGSQGFICPENFLPFLEASRQFAESKVGGVERSLEALDLMTAAIARLERWSGGDTAEHQSEPANNPALSAESSVEYSRLLAESTAPAAAAAAVQEPEQQAAAEAGKEEWRVGLTEMWFRLALALREQSLDSREAIRNHSILCLQRVLVGLQEIDPAWVGKPAWCVQVFDQLLFVLLDDLLDLAVRERTKEYRNVEATVNLALKLQSRVFLHFLQGLVQELSPLRFRALLAAVLGRMEAVFSAKLRGNVTSQMWAEAVPEVLKNTLLVMKAKGVLLQPKEGSGKEEDSVVLWEMTRRQVEAISEEVWRESFPESVEKVQQAAVLPGSA